MSKQTPIAVRLSCHPIAIPMPAHRHPLAVPNTCHPMDASLPSFVIPARLSSRCHPCHPTVTHSRHPLATPRPSHGRGVPKGWSWHGERQGGCIEMATTWQRQCKGEEQCTHHPLSSFTGVERSVVPVRVAAEGLLPQPQPNSSSIAPRIHPSRRLSGLHVCRRPGPRAAASGSADCAEPRPNSRPEPHFGSQGIKLEHRGRGHGTLRVARSSKS